MKEDWIYKRGDLYYANLNPYFGSEQGGTRPVLVLQNNVGNFFCPTLIVAPLTSNGLRKGAAHTLCTGERSRAWTEICCSAGAN